MILDKEGLTREVLRAIDVANKAAGAFFASGLLRVQKRGQQLTGLVVPCFCICYAATGKCTMDVVRRMYDRQSLVTNLAE